MTEQPTNQDPSFRAGNITSTGEVFDVGGYAELLVSDSELAKLDERERSLAIGDRIIGAIVANGNIKGSQKEYTPGEILSLFDLAARQISPDKVVEVRNSITSVAGLRKTFDILASNATGGLFGQMTERAGLGQYGQGLGSVDMLEGFLHALREKYQKEHPEDAITSSGAKEEIQDRIEEFAALDGEISRPFSETITSMSESSNDYLRQKGNGFQRALSAVRTWGTSTELLDATANRLRQHYQMGRNIGTSAMRLTVFDYNKFK